MKKLMPLLVGLVLPLTVTPQILESDSLALVDFYNALDGDNWVNNDSWLSSPVEEWHGITIDAGRVTRIRLTSNGLSGTIPLSFNDLESLEEVYLTSNEITSPLPDMSNLTNVTTFAFYDNNLNSTFPESIRNLTGIRILNLGSNSLTGELPEWLPELNRLEDLSLTTNNLNGEIIEVLRDLPNLEKIRLFGNEFSGPLPDFSIFSSLKELVVGRNDFTGTFPGWITEIDSLRYLHLGDCELSGTVPENLFSQLYPGMRQFVIYGNDFTGQLENILDAYMPEMFRFNIAGNNFTGYIPDGVFDVHNVYRWNISNNDITGLPDFSEANHTPTWFYCTNNKIGFEHLETCLSLQESRPGRLQLGPQNALLEEENLNPDAGEDILIDCGSRGMFSSYQWFKDSLPIADANDPTYRILDYGPEDDGTYHCVIANDSFEFDLTRSPLHIGSTVSTEDIDHLRIDIFPNPFNRMINVRLDNALDTEKIEIGLLDSFGKRLFKYYPNSHEFQLDISQISNSISFLKIKHGDKTWVRKIIRQ